jgi:hypothetical protein
VGCGGDEVDVMLTDVGDHPMADGERLERRLEKAGATVELD